MKNEDFGMINEQISQILTRNFYGNDQFEIIEDIEWLLRNYGYYNPLRTRIIKAPEETRHYAFYISEEFNGKGKRSQTVIIKMKQLYYDDGFKAGWGVESIIMA